MARSITVNLSSPDIINMTGSWTFNKYLKVSYSWSNAPSGMKSTVPIDSNKYKPGDLVSVDNTMTATTAYKDESAKKYYTFSGWNKSGSFNISSDINISGSWDNGKSVSNESANIYYDNSDDKKYLNYRIVTICYGNGKYVIAGWGEHWVAYSEDGINWTSKRYSTKTAQFQGRDAGYICYGNGNFIIVCNTNDNYYYTSTNLVDWTEINAGWYKSNYSQDAYYADGKFIFPSNVGTLSSGSKYNYYFHQIMMYPNDVIYIT